MNSVFRSMVFVLFILICAAAFAHAGDINLSVAASLREAVTELCNSFSKSSAGAAFQNNFGGTGALAKQIENGAPADLFFSANLEWMDYLKERKLVDERSIATLAYNTLVFVGKPTVKVASLQDLAKLERIAIGSPKSVPAGEYTVEALKKAGMDKQMESKLVMAKDVRECMLYAERGEVDGAFVYKTDALELAKNTKVLFTVPQDLYPRVTYPVALTATGSKRAEAVAFFKFLQGAEAKSVLVRHGFVVK